MYWIGESKPDFSGKVIRDLMFKEVGESYKKGGWDIESYSRAKERHRTLKTKQNKT